MNDNVPKYTAFTDGAARVSNPGEGAWGFVIFKDGEVFHEAAGYLGIVSNNVAEYVALEKLLSYAHSQYATNRIFDLQIFSDSQLVVNQVNSLWKVNSPDLRPFWSVTSYMLGRDGATLTWVPREQNQHADKLCNEVLDHVLNGEPLRAALCP